MEYYNISTAHEDGSEGVSGGMGKRRQSEQITNYIGVPSVEEYLSRVLELGGQVIMPKTPVPGFGYLAMCLDTEGNSFGLWETDEHAQ
jgi:predicted enzyme related to lactoylglutathione lyase